MGPSSPSVRNGIHLGLSFCCIFMAFSVSQNFQTSSDHKKQGANALGILYACFTLANFVSSFIVSSLGSKMCLILGSFTYVLFVAANIVYVELLLYLSSGLLGLGASVLWTAQGAYISNCSALHEQQLGLPTSSTLGFFNGLFFSIFQVNQLLGNLLAAALFKADVSTGTIFIVMTAICAVGALTLLFLNDPAKAISASAAAASTNNSLPSLSPSSSMSYESSGIRENTANSPSELHYIVAVPAPYLKRSKCAQFLSVFDSLRLLMEPRMLVLIPIMVYSGLSQSYIFGSFPPLIIDKATKFFVLAAIGAVDALASVAMGKLSDRSGRVIVLVIGFVTSGSAILFLMNWSVDQDAVYVFFLVGIVMGISDGQRGHGQRTIAQHLRHSASNASNPQTARNSNRSEHTAQKPCKIRNSDQFFSSPVLCACLLSVLCQACSTRKFTRFSAASSRGKPRRPLRISSSSRPDRLPSRSCLTTLLDSTVSREESEPSKGKARAAFD